MGATNDKASELDRSSSLRASLRFSNTQVDDDDYDLQAMGIADGFRPMEAPHTQISMPSTLPQDHHPTAQIPPPRPSSITKPHRRNDSLSLQHDGSSTVSESNRTPSRDSTGSTLSPFVDPEDPYDGPSGPSHPYQMYPQNVRVARTASLATTSTAPISERSYNGPRGPAHPYQMYPQNTIAETGGVSNPTPPGEINVGFPGTTDNYQRRIGPDGEDVADLIGPDGHTEQLPPYTRYPEETYNRKAMGLDTPQPAPVPVQPMLAIPGAGGIGIATRDPEFASTEDLRDANSPQSRLSVRSFTSESSQRQLNNVSGSTLGGEGDGARAEVSDEKKSLKDWQVTAKRRVWGIVPCWAIILAAIVLVLVGVILGAVVGTLVNPHFKKKPPPDRPPLPLATPGNDWDTQPLSTLSPTTPPLQEGEFAMPLRNNRMSNTCFTDSTLAQAWSCNIVLSHLSMKIQRLPNQPNTSDYSFGFNYNDTWTMDNYVYSYGMQPPDLTGVTLRLVNDLYEFPRGPAWNFAVAYNKTVIVPEQHLSLGAPSPSLTAENRRRMFNDYKRKGVMALTGDKPWICQWNNTILETFIYAEQNNSFSRPLDASSMSSTPVASSSVNAGGGLITTPTAQTTPTPTGIGDSGDFSELSLGPHGDPQDHTPSTPTTDSGATSTTNLSPDASASGPFDIDFPMPPLMSVYPRVIKVEERRNSDSTAIKPVCRQVQIVGEGEPAIPVLDSKGQQVEVYIDEDEKIFGEPPPPSAENSKRSFMDHYLGIRGTAKGTEMSECGCMWWLT